LIPITFLPPLSPAGARRTRREHSIPSEGALIIIPYLLLFFHDPSPFLSSNELGSLSVPFFPSSLLYDLCRLSVGLCGEIQSLSFPNWPPFQSLSFSIVSLLRLDAAVPLSILVFSQVSDESFIPVPLPRASTLDVVHPFLTGPSCGDFILLLGTPLSSPFPCRSNSTSPFVTAFIFPLSLSSDA